MSIEPVFEKIKFNSERKNLKQQIRLDCRADVPSDEISNLLSVTAWAIVSENDISGGQVRFGGKAIFYISYLDNNGTLKKCECGNEFKGAITEQTVGDDASVFVTASVDKTDFDLTGAKLTVGAYVTVCAKVSEFVYGQALCGGDNIIINEGEISCVKSCGVKSGIFPIEEEFEVPYTISEVLCHRAQAVVIGAQSGVGAVIVDGEILLSVIALQKNEKNDIIKENKVIPFRIEIENEDAMPNMRAIARAKERTHKIDVTVDEESGKSLLNASISVCLEGEAFYEQPVTVALDAFSTEKELELVKHDFTCWNFGDLSHCDSVIKERATIEELPIGAVALTVGNECIEGLSVRLEGGKVVVNGLLLATIYLRDGQDLVFTRNVQTAFESELNSNIECDQKCEVFARVKNARVKIVSLEEVEIEAELCFSIYPEKQSEIRLISEVKECGDKKQSDCA
jgi:hypothetical protein